MRYLLDTDTCIGFLRDAAPKTKRRLGITRPSEIWLCSIVLFELLIGARRSLRPDEEQSKILGFTQRFKSAFFDDECARVAARIRANLEAVGKGIGPNDTLIAAIALHHQLILVTRNLGEFTRVEGLSVEDWEA